MGPSERRMKLLETLNLRRDDTYDNLANEFDVSPMTSRRDVSGGRRIRWPSRLFL